MLGYTDFVAGEVVLSLRLDQAQRRSTIEHERQHCLRGPVMPHMEAREERVVDNLSSRLLLPDIARIGDAMVWTHSLAEAADELWVDEQMLKCRLEHLHPSERGYLRRRLEES